MAAVPKTSVAGHAFRLLALSLALTAFALSGVTAAPPQRIISLIPSTTEMLFAMGEAIAHLNHLLCRGAVVRETGSDDVIRFAAH